jgi:hypothetical protein
MANTRGAFDIDKGNGAGRFLITESGKFKICGTCCGDGCPVSAPLWRPGSGKECPKNYRFQGHQASTLVPFDRTFVWKPSAGTPSSSCVCLWAPAAVVCYAAFAEGLVCGRYWGTGFPTPPACGRWEAYIEGLPGTPYWWDVSSPAKPCPSTTASDWVVFNTDRTCSGGYNLDWVMDAVTAW